MKFMQYLKSLGLFGLVALLVWQLVPDHTVEKSAQAKRHTADWFGRDVLAIEMNEQGTPKRQFHADELTHYLDENVTDMIEPHFTIFRDNTPNWHLEGHKGRTFHGKHTMDIARLDLWQDVKLWNDDKTKPVNVNTSTIAIFPEKEFAQTDQRISFDQPGHRLTGTGLKAYFDTQAMELLSDVRSEHVANGN